MVRPSIPLVVLLAASASLDVLPGCPARKPDDWEERQRIESATTVDAALAGPILVSQAVPADAAAVVVLRTPDGLFDLADVFGWFGPPDPAADEALRAEVDAFLRERIGVALTSASTATVFYSAAPESFGVILEYVDGEPIGPEHSRHGDTILRTLDQDLLIAKRGVLLLLGTEQGLIRMLDTIDGKHPALLGSEGGLNAMLAEHSAGASFVVVGELAQLPAEIAEPAKQMGVERGYFGIGPQGLHAVATGTPEGMTAAAQLINLGLEQAQGQLDAQKQAAMAGDGVFEGVGSIIGAHTGKRLVALLKPTVEGGRLTIDVPLQLGDTTTIVALGGIMAVIAVPALQQYMRRAKTSEAKVQLAKLHDAVATYFMAEQALHRCPNNGAQQGEAGVTPPLSVDCNEGPGGRCVPAAAGSGAGYYDTAVWTDNPVWKALDYAPDQGHYFHYNFIWRNFGEDDGYGACQFTIQAFADLDDDGVFSTYERYGAGDVEGVAAAEGLYIDNELE